MSWHIRLNDLLALATYVLPAISIQLSQAAMWEAIYCGGMVLSPILLAGLPASIALGG
jgi:hypothetical protein